MTITFTPQQQILDAAEQYAQDIIDSGKREESSTIEIRPRYYTPSPWYDPYYYHRPYYYHSTPCCPPISSDNKKSKKEGSEAAVLVLVAGVVISMAAVYFIAADVAHMALATALEKDLKKQKAHTYPELAPVVDLQKQMLQNEKNSHQIGLLSKGALALSASAAVAGVVMALPFAVTAGVIGTLASGAGLLVRQGYVDADTTSKEDAARLLKRVTEIRSNLA